MSAADATQNSLPAQQARSLGPQLILIRMIISAQIVSLYPPSQRLYIAYSCDVLRFIIRNDTALTQRFPACLPVVNGTNTLGEALQVAVQANFAGARQGRPEEVSAVLQACFPMAAWLAWALHVIGTEVYLKLTPRESERLRQISYVKQVNRHSPWRAHMLLHKKRVRY